MEVYRDLDGVECKIKLPDNTYISTPHSVFIAITAQASASASAWW